MAKRAGTALTHGLSGPRTLRRPAPRPGPGSCRDQAISSRQSPLSAAPVERYEDSLRLTACGDWCVLEHDLTARIVVVVLSPRHGQAIFAQALQGAADRPGGTLARSLQHVASR